MSDELDLVAPQDDLNHEDVTTTPEASPAIVDEPSGDDPGPIPFSEHQKALENARAKATEEAAGQYRFLGGRNAQEVMEALTLYDYRTRDPEGFGAYGASLSPTLRERLVAPVQQATQTADPALQPVLDQYTNQYYYSKEQLDKIRDLDKSEYRRIVEEETKPLKQWMQHSSQAAQQAKAQQQEVERLAHTLPEFDNYLEDIISEMSKDGRLGVEGAYRRVWDAKILPNLRKQQKTQTMDALTKKARASNESKPSAGGGDVSNRRKYSRGARGFDEVFAEIEGASA